MSETRYYLLREYDQIRKTWKEMGFWDDSKHNWIRKLYYGNKWGSDYENHDWLYSMRMQAETLLSAMISKNEEVDNHLHKEFNYMHHKIGEDGTVIIYILRHSRKLMVLFFVALQLVADTSTGKMEIWQVRFMKI